ncbi:MAG: hypothetical protein RBR06_10610 [Desulfuromonadaceae bacterium]|nr:hypothetical protein [Desulfuromonadaceae bacterium]
MAGAASVDRAEAPTVDTSVSMPSLQSSYGDYCLPQTGVAIGLACAKRHRIAFTIQTGGSVAPKGTSEPAIFLACLQAMAPARLEKSEPSHPQHQLSVLG